jgi:hypothetical protein
LSGQGGKSRYMRCCSVGVLLTYAELWTMDYLWAKVRVMCDHLVYSGEEQLMSSASRRFMNMMLLDCSTQKHMATELSRTFWMLPTSGTF